MDCRPHWCRWSTCWRRRFGVRPALARDVVRRPVAAPRYVVLQSGLTYRGARLAYKTHGTLNAARSNVIVYPTSYGAQHPDLEWLIAPGNRSKPSTLSSSSTCSATGCHPRPATRRRSTAAVTSISRRPTMSGCSSGCWRRCSAASASRWFTASRWGRSRPSIGWHCSPTGSSGIAPICGSAKTSAHNFVFLEGVKAALTADPVWQDGGFATPPTRGFQAMGRV